MTLINCDMGESYGIWKFGDDSRIMPAIHIANVACGFHASDFNHMRATVRLAKQHGVKVGAHPSLPDRQGFGRREMKIDREELANCIIYQVGALKGFLDAEGMQLHHIKPHGSLFVMASRDPDIAHAICDAAGGATAAHITALAREMGIDTIILPKLASGLCAFGQIISDVKYNYMATIPVRLDTDVAYARIDALYQDLEARGTPHLASDGFDAGTIDVKRSLDMRYVGQVHECTVDIPRFAIDAGSIDRVKDAFHRRHEELYTYSERHNAVEVVNIEATLFGRIEKPGLQTLAAGAPEDATLKGHRTAIFAASGEGIDTPIYDGSKLGAGSIIAGPAIIEEVTTTIVIEPGWTSALHQSGSYVLTRQQGS